MLTESVESAGLTSALHDSLSPETRELAAYVAWAFGTQALAVIHYGSRAQGRRTRDESAFDFFVVVDGYASGYRALAARAGLRRPAWVASTLARILPPNVIALRGPTSDGEHTAKLAVFSLRDFRRATSPRARDHFALGRLMQHVVIAWTRDALAEERIVECIAEARRRTFDWGRPFLPIEFDAEEFCRTLLAQSLSGEIRPEPPEFAMELLSAQRSTIVPMYADLLNERHRRGELGRRGSAYVLPRPTNRFERVRAGYYFRRSKVRNTLRLFKYIALYDGWMDYIVHKVARSSGQHFEMTERERRWPLLFGWPKFIRYLRTRPQRRH